MFLLWCVAWTFFLWHTIKIHYNSNDLLIKKGRFTEQPYKTMTSSEGLLVIRERMIADMFCSISKHKNKKIKGFTLERNVIVEITTSFLYTLTNMEWNSYHWCYYNAVFGFWIKNTDLFKKIKKEDLKKEIFSKQQPLYNAKEIDRTLTISDNTIEAVFFIFVYVFVIYHWSKTNGHWQKT